MDSDLLERFQVLEMHLNFACVLLISMPPGLLYIQNGDSLTDLSGFENLVHVDTLVLAQLGESVTDIAGFSSLHSVSRLYITRNSVSIMEGGNL